MTLTSPFLSNSRPSRRRFLSLTGAAALTGTLPVGRLAFAQGVKERPLVVVLLRGGLDGQALLPLFGDPAYRQQRGSLALSPPDGIAGTIDLDGHMGLHPTAEALLPFWEDGHMAALPAVASPYRGRSHFEAQNVLESGLDAPDMAAESGWLNRALTASGRAENNGGAAAVALGRDLPLILRGPAQTDTWNRGEVPELPPGFFVKVKALYGEDPQFLETLEAGLASRDAMEAALGQAHGFAEKMGTRPQDFIYTAEIAGKTLAAAEGPGIAVIEIGGWDTHAQQGTMLGPLARKIAGLAEGLAGLAEALGDRWADSAILVVSEFGRTVQPNGTGGTDHGTGGAALVLSGTLGGSKRLGPLPGLAPDALLEGRDLAPTVDSRALFKAVLAKHWGMSRSVLDKRVFPGSDSVAPLEGL